MTHVMISYGHGKETYEVYGSKGVTVNGVKYAEHTHNAEVGTRLKKILEAHGIRVSEANTPFGYDVPLRERTDKANSLGVNLYWSIHSNAGVSTARGWCAFYWGTSAPGMKLAQLYAKHVKADLGLPLYSTDGIYPSAPGTWSDFHELRETNMLAVLAENGFMTNSLDFEYIFKNKDNYYNKMAYAHAKAICEYFGIAYDPIKSGEVAPVAENVIVDIFTGGYIGETLMKIHNELFYRGYGYSPARGSAGHLFFKVGPFVQGSNGYNSLKSFLDVNGLPYDIIVR